ncbi:hypothetical protein SNE40_006300 [Patella caerulea]|uniref:Transmembrane protein n=1 Tax=Patella caerulea TaxID=87958 RepID=A0AAN8K034_PATCE
MTSSQNVMTSSQYSVMSSSQYSVMSSQYSVMSSQTPEVTSSQNIVTSSQTPASSSVAPTTTYYNPLIPPSGRKMCPCRCKPRKTPEEIRNIIKSINDDLHVDVEKLSATIAKKNSAEDNRISSISLGVSSILLVVGFIGLFVFPDFIRVAIATKEFVSWLLSRRKNKDETFEMTSDC